MCKRLQTSSVNSLKNIREKKRTSPTSNTDNNKDIQNIIDNRCNEQASIDIPKGNSLDVKKIIDETSKSYLEKNQKLFNRYCLECHGASQPVINLPLESLDQMANYRPILGTTTPLQRLEMKSMPPSYSSLKPSDEERQQMIEILSELKSK